MIKKTNSLPREDQPLIEVNQLSVAYEEMPALWDLSFQIPRGKMVAIVGPNGAGKSTLLASLVQQIPIFKGDIRFWGRDFKDVRRQIAYVPQAKSVDWDFPMSVEQLVMMGRYGHLGWLQRPSAQDYHIVEESLARVEMASFAKRHISQLSGGQKQRAFFARALAQQASLYLLDEPFSAVDLATEKQLVASLRALVDEGSSVLVVHHDLHTVPTYFDHILLLNVRLVASGNVSEVFTAANIDLTYGRPVALLDQVTKAQAIVGNAADAR